MEKLSFVAAAMICILVGQTWGDERSERQPPSPFVLPFIPESNSTVPYQPLRSGATLRRYPFAEIEADYAGFYDFVVSGGVDFWRAGWWVASLFAGIVAARFVRANVLIAQGTA